MTNVFEVNGPAGDKDKTKKEERKKGSTDKKEKTKVEQKESK